MSDQQPETGGTERADLHIRTLLSGVAFGESVRWHDDRVWFCDWVDQVVVSIAPDGSDRRVHARLDGAPICIDWRPNGSLVVVDGAGRRLFEKKDAGDMAETADLTNISEGAWNEVAVHQSGQVYVNGIGYDMMAGEPPTSGQIAVVETDGSTREVATDLQFPNGMVITDDGMTLLVAESHAGKLTAFTIDDAGNLSDRRTFAEIEGSAPDGICLAPDGTVWYADVPNRHCRRVAEGGTVADTIEIDRGCFSCALSPDGTLYIAAARFDMDTFAASDGVILAAEVDTPTRGVSR